MSLTVSNFNPDPTAGNISPTATVAFDAVDAQAGQPLGLPYSIIILIYYPSTSGVEVAWDGSEFTPLFNAQSSMAEITNGLHVVVGRAGGWPANPSFVVRVIGGGSIVEISDGTNIIGTAAHPVRVDPTGTTTQPISAAALPLPAGAATDAVLTGGTAKVQVTDGTNTLGTSGHPVRVDPTGTTTQPISAAALPLPVGAATDATLTGGTARSVVRGAAKGATVAADVTSAAVDANTQALHVQVVAGGPAVATTANQGTAAALGGAWPVEVTDGTNVLGTSSHPVRVDSTGTTTQPVSAAALPLPAGAAQDSTLTGGTQKAIVRGGAKGGTTAADVTSTSVDSNTQALHVQVVNQITDTANQGTAAALAGAWPVEVTDGTNVLGTSGHPVRTDPTGTTTQPVSGSVSVSNFPATQPVSGTVTAGQGTAAALAGAWPTKVTDGTNTMPTGDTPARSLNVEVTDGTNVLGTSAHPVKTDPTGTTTQPVSGTVTAGQGTAAGLGAAWPVKLTDGTNTMPTGDAVARSLAVQVNDGSNVIGSAAHPVKVDPTGTTTQPVSGTVSSSQGTAAALAGAWPTKVTDGTNTMPTGDAPARSLSVEVTDGTNVLGTSGHPVRTDPTGTTTQPVSGTVAATQSTAAALAGAWPTKVTDGTNTLPTMDVAAGAEFVKLTDGTNSAPTGDTPGRAGYERITDGTNTATIKAASTAVLSTDTALAVGLHPSSPLPSGTNPIGQVTAVGAAASGSAVSGNPVLVAGKDPSGNAQALAVAADKSLLSSLDNNQQVIHSNATVSASSSVTFANLGHKEVNLVINVKAAPTGTTPTLQYSIQEIDPGDLTTAVGTSVTGTTINTATTQQLKLPDTTTGAIKITWTIGGTASPTFTGVYATLSVKPTEDVAEQFAPVYEDNTVGVAAVVVKPTSVGTYCPSLSTTVAAASANVKNAAGNLFSFTATCRTATVTVWLQLFNAASAPSSGNTALYQWPINTTANPAYIEVGRDFFGESGVNFTTGISWGMSTTKNTFTAATAADCDVAMTYK